MNRRLIPAVALCVAGILANPGTSWAHHTDVECVAPATWSITNSEPLTMTYTTDQGHSGSIGPNGTVQVAYSGTSLTVSGVWSNGVTATNTGTGDCTVTTTTTTVVATTTTQPGSTTSLPVTTIVTTSSSSTTAPTSTSPSPSSTTSPPSAPSTTQPGESSTLPPPSSTPTTPPPNPPTTVPSGDCYPTSSTSSSLVPTPSTVARLCETPSLPATGPSDTTWYVAALAALCCTIGALTTRWTKQAGR